MSPYFFILLIIPLLVVPTAYGWQNVLCNIAIFGTDDMIQCAGLRDTITLQQGDNISISLDNSTNTITIATTGGEQPFEKYCSGTEKIFAFNATTNQFYCSNDLTVEGILPQSIVCSGTDKVSSYDADTGLFVCTADVEGEPGTGEANTGANVGTGEGMLFRDKTGVTLNFKTLKQSDNIILTNNTNDVTIRGVNTAQIVSAGGTSLFKSRDNATQNTIKGLTATRGIILTANTDDVQIDTNFKVNSKSSATRQFLTSFNNATTDGNFGTITFGINTKTCSGTDKISAIDNATGAVTCSADQTGGGGGGSGIPYNKLWGSFVARSTTGALDGFLTGATLDGTETYTYDTTMASSVISSASGTTAGNNAGLSQVATNTNVFRRDQNALLYAEWRMTEITTNRIFIGFQSGTTPLPNASDDMLNAASGYGLCIQSTDTIYQVCRNDGSGATVFASLGVTEDTDRHTVLIKADSANNRWCISLDGAADTCHTTDIPAATTRLFVSVSGETTDTSGTTFIYSKVYVQNDR
jgi:hypothetical protein